MINSILKECINKLELLQAKLTDVENSSKRSEGINGANASIKESIETRIHILTDIYSDSADEGKYTNADYALFCMEFTDSLAKIFKELSEECDNNDFGSGYKEQVNYFLMLLQPVQDWLKSESIQDIYN